MSEETDTEPEAETLKIPCGALMDEAFQKFLVTGPANDLLTCVKMCRPDDGAFALKILRLAFLEGFDRGMKSAFTVTGLAVRNLSEFAEADCELAKATEAPEANPV